MNSSKLIQNKYVSIFIKDILEEQPNILEFGACRDAYSSQIFVKYLGTSAKMHIVDPSIDAINTTKNIIKNRNVFFHNKKGEDLEDSLFANVGLVHLDGYDIVTKHKHKKTTIEAYRKIGHDLLLHGNYRSAYSHYLIVKKLLKNNNGSVICVFDDSWIDRNNLFQGKGASAIPYLLANGFKILKIHKTLIPFSSKSSIALVRFAH